MNESLIPIVLVIFGVAVLIGAIVAFILVRVLMRWEREKLFQNINDMVDELQLDQKRIDNEGEEWKSR